MKKKTKRSFSIIEILIGFSLATLLLTSLLFSYSYMQILVTKQINEMEESLKEIFFNKRMESIFQEVEHFEKEGSIKKCGFYNSDIAEGSLVFTMDNHVDPTSHYFSNQVVARLYINPEKQLCLNLWGHPNDYPDQDAKTVTKKEVLLDGVENISFRFYKPRKVNSNLVINLEEANWGWQDSWDLDDSSLPAMCEISLLLVNKQKSSLFYYPLPKSSHQVVFSQ